MAQEESRFPANASLATRGMTASFGTEVKSSSQPPTIIPQVFATPASAILQRTRGQEYPCTAGMHNRSWVTTTPVPNQPYLTKRIYGDHLHIFDPITMFYGDGQPITLKTN
uniref:Uncharacterized protein n=1 Tax=Alexandrium catenella TaxID=2925 RepID=A0A7S1RPL2_ALECA|mmetsp:Transcript_67444/g.179599  ORF Transcript_67444/g.179599 Transcript_67444/m.179599 type:complete len:111 (+) Transcript_67444:78-410(+)